MQRNQRTYGIMTFSNEKTYTKTLDYGPFRSTVTASFNDSPWVTLQLVARGPYKDGKPVTVTYSSIEDFKKIVTKGQKISPEEFKMYSNISLELVQQIFTDHIVTAEKESWVQPTNWRFDR